MYGAKKIDLTPFSQLSMVEGFISSILILSESNGLSRTEGPVLSCVEGPKIVKALGVGLTK